MAISTSLGHAREVDLPGGRIRYYESGEGSPVVFLHGLLVNADLWRKVVPGIAAAGYRCIAPDLPLGSHEIPVPTADLTPTGVADLIAAFLDRLDLEDVTLVANDTGGAITQVLLARNRARIGRVVLTSCDSYADFLPKPLSVLPVLAKVPGIVRPIVDAMRIRALQRSPLGFGLVAKHPIPPQIADSYLLPTRRSGAIRKDLRRVLLTLKREYTLEAAKHFAEIDLPIHIVWAAEDRIFALDNARRLTADLPNATLRLIDDSYAFLSEDQPELLTSAILEFTRLHATP